MADSLESARRLLLVEGQDDDHVIRHLRQRCCPELEFDIWPAGGVDDLFQVVRLAHDAPDRVALGIVIDADNAPDVPWRRVKGRLETAGVHLPTDPVPSGAIVPGAPRVGVWIMPDNRAPGALEDFVATMIPDDDPVWPLACDYIRRVPADCLEIARSKAEIHAWLATREAPRMGTAIRSRALRPESVSVTAFLSWLRELFD